MSECTFFVFRIVIVPATSPLGIPGSNILCDDDVHAGSVVLSPSRPMVYYSGSLANYLVDPNSTDFRPQGTRGGPSSAYEWDLHYN